MSTETAEPFHYLQWVGIDSVRERINQGWTIAEDLKRPCHHNEHGVVLMQAPEWWEPPCAS